jgi:hypothetical protein
MIRRVLVFLSFGLVLATAGGVEAQRKIRINVESTPPGATVYLDSEDGAPLGTTPITAALVPAGNHTLIFKKENHETAKLNVRVARWRETFRAVLSPLSTLVITPSNQEAQGATVTISGENVGTVPFDGTLQPGRHFLEIKKDGFKTFSQWLSLRGGQSMTLPVMLERDAPKAGSILVAGSRPGATVFLDGQPKGVTPTVLEDVPVGDHVIEVRSDGVPPHQETVRIEAGKRVVVSPQFKVDKGGSIRVITQPTGATILVNGEPVGQAPLTHEGLAEGEHIVEAQLDGYDPVEETIRIEAGQQRVASLRFTSRRPGRIVVDATVQNAVVLVDGEEKGPPPVVIEDATPGMHAIVVRARGYQDFRTTCHVAAERDCEIMARMDAQGQPVRVEANVPAQFYVDDELMGPVPWEGEVPGGSRRIEVRADGYVAHVQQVNLTHSSETRTFNVALLKEGEKTDEDAAAERAALVAATREASSYSASPLPQDMTVVDVSGGWPFLAEGRLGVGILPFLEAGFAMRTFVRLTEFEGRVKAGYRPVKQLALGAQFKMGGGIGPSRSPRSWETDADPDASNHSTNSFFMSLEALGTLHFSRAGAFTLWFAADFTSDQWNFMADQRNTTIHEIAGEGFPRQNMWRARIGGSLEILINRNWNIFGILEGIVAGDNRRIFGDIWSAGNSDLKLYFRGGFTYKFGLARDEGQTFGAD